MKRDESTRTANIDESVKLGESTRIGPFSALSVVTLPSQAYPTDTTSVLARMLDRYERNGRAQPVSFRRLVPWLKVGERATHYLHPYPAKLLPQIAHFFLSATQMSAPGDSVLDPFGGSGTVALEALLARRRALFADVNPLARFIAQVKTHPIAATDLQAALGRVERMYKSRKGLPKGPVPPVINIEHWYTPATIRALRRLRRAIDQLEAGAVRDLLLLSFSATCRKVSLADPRLSVPVRMKEEAPPSNSSTADSVWARFAQQMRSNSRRMEDFVSLLGDFSGMQVPGYVGDNAATLIQMPNREQPLKAGSVSLVITSPPYAGAQKYIRASSLNLGWLGLADSVQMRALESRSIGREKFAKELCAIQRFTGISSADRLISKIHKINPLRGTIVSTYLNEMRQALTEIERVLSPGGHLVLIIGNNQVCGLPFKSSTFLQSICEGLNLTVRLRLLDEIRSRGLMTKRNKTANVITREWVLVFQKPASG